MEQSLSDKYFSEDYHTSDLRVSLFKMAKAFLLNPDLFLSKKKYLFVIGHMRCYSSMLSHILGSHEQVSGYSEMQQPYHGYYDLMKLRYRVYLSCDKTLKGNFILDKILHNQYNIPLSFFESQNFIFIFLLRKPELSFRSILRMAQKNQGVIFHWSADHNLMLDYYLKRLALMEQYAMKLRNNAVFIPAERLMENTEVVLQSLSGWLKFGAPLQQHYDLFKYSGYRGFGDAAGNVLKGKVISGKDVEEKEIFIDPEIINVAGKAYEQCYRVLEKHCLVIK